MKKISLGKISDILNSGPLWERGDGIYTLKITKESAVFKNGDASVQTTKGFISINDLFWFANQELKSLFFKDGNFVLNSNIELEIELKNKSIISVKKFS